MSLKQDRKSRSSIGRFIAALLRPFMSEPPPPQLPYLFFHSPDARHTENVVDWNSHMSQYFDDDDDTNCYAKCFLRQIEYCKCSQGVEHEFLVFYFGHWTSRSSAVGVVCADRTVSIHSDNSSSSEQPSGLVSPSSTDNIAHDTITIIGSPHDATRYLTKTLTRLFRCLSLLVHDKAVAKRMCTSASCPNESHGRFNWKFTGSHALD